MVGVLFREAVLSPSTTTTESADRIGMRRIMNEARPAVQLASPYQLVKTAPSCATQSTFGVGCPSQSRQS